FRFCFLDFALSHSNVRIAFESLRNQIVKAGGLLCIGTFARSPFVVLSITLRGGWLLGKGHRSKEVDCLGGRSSHCSSHMLYPLVGRFLGSRVANYLAGRSQARSRGTL